MAYAVLRQYSAVVATWLGYCSVTTEVAVAARRKRSAG